MKGVTARAYSTNYFQRPTLESWYTKKMTQTAVINIVFQRINHRCLRHFLNQATMA